MIVRTTGYHRRNWKFCGLSIGYPEVRGRWVSKFGGLYSVAVSLAEIASRVSRELGTILFPAFVSGQVSNTKAVAIIKSTFILAVILGLFLALVGNYLIVGLFGSRFADSVIPFYFLLPGLVAWNSIYVTWNHVSASVHPGLGIPVFGAAATLDIILNLAGFQIDSPPAFQNHSPPCTPTCVPG